MLYADDIVLISDNPIEMQHMLDCVTEWCKAWKMNINMSKTKLMEIRRKGTERSVAKFKINNKSLEKCQFYKYLGIIFDEFLEFEINAEALAASGQRALGSLISKYKKLTDIGFDTYTKCFKACICPVIDYGAEVLICSG